jgi:F-type H+-transporting ATPase subunit b
MTSIQTPEFWVAIGFLLLIALIAKPAWKGVTGALDSRSEKIKATLDEAASLREEVQHLLADYQRKQRDVAKEVDEILANAIAEAEHSTSAASEELSEALKRREELAMEKILQAEAEAMQAVRNTAIDVAIFATERVLKNQLNEAAATKLLDNSIAELPAKLN